MASVNPKKRKVLSAGDADGHPNKKRKGVKKWSTTRPHVGDSDQIEPGDAGIWASCTMGQEAKCVHELRMLFDEYVHRLYGSDDQNTAENDDTGDIEAELAKELDDMRKPRSEYLLQNVKLSTPCLVFFKTQQPIDPTELVRAICKDAARDPERKRSRFVQRLTPITLTSKATEPGLEKAAQQVLAPHFHQEATPEKSFAIRPNLRNHDTLTRDQVIKTVARAVGHNHRVDLKAPDLIILVEIFKNICGVSVVPGDFEKLRRYNLSELHKAA